MVRVQYDDAAFYIFAMSILSVYVFPATYLIAGKISREVLFPSRDPGRRLLAGEEKKSQQLKAELRKAVWTPCFTAQVVVLVVAWICLFVLATSFTASGDIKQFDPFEILGLEPDASEREIRRAYRKLSLLYHPDKNPGDAEAEAKFMLVSKANEALTDEEAKKNYEEFGSPDGKQQMQVSIGLPSFFMTKAYHTAILIVYVVVLVVLIPILVGSYYHSSVKYGDNDIMKATYDKIFALFKPGDGDGFFNPKICTEILGAAEEFMDLKYKEADKAECEKMWKKFAVMGQQAQTKLVAKPKAFKGRGPNVSKHDYKCFLNNVVLTAYLMRWDLTPTNRENARLILAQSPRLLEAIIKQAYMVGVQSPRSASWVVVNELIMFQQRLHQCLWDSGDRARLMYLQLPHLTEEVVVKQILGKNRKGGRIIPVGHQLDKHFEAYGQMQEYLRLAPEDRRGLQDLTEEQKRDVHDVAAVLPNWDVDVDVFVEGEDVISEGAFLTIRFRITRNEVEEGKLAPEIFAPHFPTGKYEGIWLLLGQPWPEKDKKMAGDKVALMHKLLQIKKLSTRDRFVEGVLQFRAPQKGRYSMTVAARSDCYFGCDFQQEIVFDVTSADDPKLTVFERHEEDNELMKELHGEIVGGTGGEDSETDSDSDDDDAPESKSKQEDEDEDEDDESEDSDSSTE